MADVKIVDIDGEQWNIKDQEARNKNTEQDTKIENLTSKISLANTRLKRFYYDVGTDKEVLQNRIDAMLYCYNNSESGIVTIRYAGGYYHNVIMPAPPLHVNPNFIEIGHKGEINIFRIRSSTDYELVREI